MNEDKLISLAIEKNQRARYRELLANNKKRYWLLGKLNHSPPLDPKYTKWFSSFTKAIQSIDVPPSTEVYILSSATEIDGKHMSFKEAIDEVLSYGWGAIIGISSSLAVYYGEEGERGAIIKGSQR